MAQATKFYLPFFKTGYPQGKLYTYISETNTPALTYSDSDGTLNTNPIIMNSKGECVIYIDKDTTYRYALYDKNDVLIYDESNIKQLNGEPGAPGGPQGAKGERGRAGNQGLSGIDGPLGLNGPTGDKGQPYLTQIKVTSNQNITIPQGVSSIYITSTGGGGSAGSWSPYVLMIKSINTSKTPYTTNNYYKLLPENTISNITGESYEDFKFSTLIMTPGSGFSGQCNYREEFLLDSSKENILQIFIGSGGSRDSISTNGQAGGATSVYINGIIYSKEEGGGAGKNIFPIDGGTFPDVGPGRVLRLNKGYKSSLIFFETDSYYGMSNEGGSSGTKFYKWPTTYKKKSGDIFVMQGINLSYNKNLFSYNTSNLSKNIRMIDNIVDLNGSSNIFGNYYSYRPKKDEWISMPSDSQYKTGVKSTNYLVGWGAGGDVFYNETGKQSNVNSYFLSNLFPTSTNVSKFYIFDKNYAKEKIRTYMKNFRIYDSFSSGVSNIPSLNDNSGVWDQIDEMENTVNTTLNAINFTGTGFYKGIRQPKMATISDSRGGEGVAGFVLIEYGSLVDHDKSEIISSEE